MSKDTNSTRANLGQALLSLELFKSVITREPIEYIKNLIDRGADVNITLNNGDTPLYEVCEHDYPEIATLLINNGAKVDFSLLKAFVRYDEEVQIDAIIDNQPPEPVKLHLREGRNTEILEHLHFPREFDGTIHLIGNDGSPELELHFDAGPEYILK